VDEDDKIFEEKWAKAKKLAEDPRIELDEQFGRIPSGTTRKNMLAFEALQKEKERRKIKKNLLVKPR
jgi:hypothetical protein